MTYPQVTKTVTRARARTLLRHALVSSALALAFAASARAETRLTSFATFMHVGPGRQYAVSDELPTRTQVEVTGCENNWCQIRYGAASGWIDQHMLATAAPPPSAKPADCFDFARTGWPNTGDHERLCIDQPAAAPPLPATPGRP